MSNHEEENSVVCPAEGNVFYAVAIEILREDPDTGKIKKVKEEHLVDGKNVTEVENKVKKEMAYCTGDWKIVNCKVSKIVEVY